MQFFSDIWGAVKGASSYINYLIYVAIAVLFVLGFIKCVLPVMHTRNVLSRASSRIKNGKKSWQEDDFLGTGTLYSHWSEYLNNLFFAEGNYHNPSNVEDFINEETVIYGPGNSNFADALPSLMVSLGFMGTLLGLAMGLSGFNMGNEESLMASIETLIPGMKYAFMTSIVGVIGSVTFTLILRIVDGSAQRALTRFYGAMSRHAGVLSVDPMTQVAIYQQEQTALIKSLSSNISQELSVTLKEALQPLENSFSRFVTVTTQEQMRFLDTVVTRFVSHMDQALHGQFSDLADTISRTIQTQQRLLDSVEAQIGDINRTAELAGSLEKSLRSTVSGVDSFVAKLLMSQTQLDDVYKQISLGMQAIADSTDKQGEFIKDMERIQQTSGEAMQSMALMTAELRAASESVRQAAAAAQDVRDAAADNVKEVSDRMAAAQRDAMKQAEDELSEMLGAMRRYQRDYNARVADIMNELTENLEALPARVNAATGATAEQIDRMNAALNRAQRSLNDAVDMMERMR